MPDQPALKPDDEFVIRDLETLKVMADPLRLRILEAMTERVCTVKQIAADLNIQPTKLYYHFKQLEEHGLIRVVDTRLVSGIVEKLYQASAYNYRVDKGLLSPGTPEGDRQIKQMLSAMFDDTRDDILKSIAAGVIKLTKDEPDKQPGPYNLVMGRSLARMSPERAIDFYSRLQALVKEFGDEKTDAEQAYTLVVALYPTARRRPPQE
jgi:DNA-binding transcriptional ArsR family regulator